MIIIAIVIFAVFLVFIFMYNSFIYKENQVNNVFSTVDVLLQKRYDLVPNLVATVKGYAAHEKEIFEKISKLRAQGISNNITNDEKINIDNQISKFLGSIFAISENYPELKASQNFLQLQKELFEIEEQISAGRRAYNASVTDYNNSAMMFPTNLVAKIFGFQIKTLFQIDEGKAENKNWFNEG